MKSPVEEPIALAGLKCRNRIIRSAVHSFLGTADGRMGEGDFQMYEELAQNGVGLIITGHACVARGGRANEEQLNLFDDAVVEDIRRAAALTHEAGARFVVQLSHAGPRAIDTEDLADVSARPLKKDRTARAMTQEEIASLSKAFATAAVRAQKGGADGVQIHAAHSYLVSRFLDPFFNARTDEYGGDASGRFRLLAEIIEAIRERCGKDFPILIKINSDTKGADTAYEADLRFYLERCKALGVALVELSGADFINLPKTARLYYLERAKKMRAAVDLPLSLVGGVRSLADMEAVLTAGLDMVSLGRPLISDSGFLAKALAGENSRCLSCNRCFVLPRMHPGTRCVLHRKKPMA